MRRRHVDERGKDRDGLVSFGYRQLVSSEVLQVQLDRLFRVLGGLFDSANVRNTTRKQRH